MTHRLYYFDSYVRHFEARVLDIKGNKVYLDQTAFYPTSGGQPFDTGLLGRASVEDVVDEEDRIAHIVRGDLALGPVVGEIDWNRRFDHMQQHSGQHLLSAVFTSLFGMETVAVHFGDEASTIELSVPAVSAAQIAQVEERAMEIVFENRPVTVEFADASAGLDLRKKSEREGELRIVTIADLDRSACGGTHVRSTAEIGPVVIRRQEKIRGNTRLEFICGMRTVRRARADFDALSAVAKSFTASLDEVPSLVKSLMERSQEAEKARKKLILELAQYQGRELHAATAPGEDGTRRVVVREPITDDLRARAQAFASLPQSVFIAASENPPALLVAASKDSGYNAGERLKSALAAAGGRGGGSAGMAQGSVPDAEALQRAVKALL